jgi:hypothetical protein
MKTHVSPEKYFLFDTNVIIGYYIPQAVGKKTEMRGRVILDSYRKGAHPDWCLLVPNIVIAEVFSVFSKYCFGTWNSHVKAAIPGGLDGRIYKTICQRFHEHIHNGQLFHQVELSRYHILAMDLIAPIDHNYKHYRGKKRKKPMETADMLILCIGIHLSHQYGRNRFMIVTADQRMADICNKAGGGISKTTAEKLGIIKTAEKLGYEYSPLIYPRILNLAQATNSDLRDAFGDWPLEVPKKSKTKIPAPFN